MPKPAAASAIANSTSDGRIRLSSAAAERDDAEHRRREQRDRGAPAGAQPGVRARRRRRARPSIARSRGSAGRARSRAQEARRCGQNGWRRWRTRSAGTAMAAHARDYAWQRSADRESLPVEDGGLADRAGRDRASRRAAPPSPALASGPGDQPQLDCCRRVTARRGSHHRAQPFEQRAVALPQPSPTARAGPRSCWRRRGRGRTRCALRPGRRPARSRSGAAAAMRRRVTSSAEAAADGGGLHRSACRWRRSEGASDGRWRRATWAGDVPRGCAPSVVEAGRSRSRSASARAPFRPAGVLALGRPADAALGRCDGAAHVAGDLGRSPRRGARRRRRVRGIDRNAQRGDGGQAPKPAASKVAHPQNRCRGADSPARDSFGQALPRCAAMRADDVVPRITSLKTLADSPSRRLWAAVHAAGWLFSLKRLGYNGRRTRGKAMSGRTCLAIVLAAGEGTRMRSSRPKVLHAIAGRSLLAHVLAALAEAGSTHAAVVVGPDHDAVAAEARAGYPKADVFVQNERRGTAHAVLAAARRDRARRRRRAGGVWRHAADPPADAGHAARRDWPMARPWRCSVSGRPIRPATGGW